MKHSEPWIWFNQMCRPLELPDTGPLKIPIYQKDYHPFSFSITPSLISNYQRRILTLTRVLFFQFQGSIDTQK
jgi:hypothetical protein